MITPKEIEFDFESAIDEFRNCVIGTTTPDRPKLTCATDTFFTKILKEKLDVKCFLRNMGIHMRKANSRKKKIFAFNGKFHCIIKDCRIEYRIVLKSVTDKVIHVSWTNIPCDHRHLNKSHKLTGENRKRIALELSAYGTSNYIDSKIIMGEEIDKKKRQVLKVVKHEFDHEHRLSRSFFTDCYASKTFSEKTCLSVSNTCTFRGMVQAIYQQPFGLLLFSEIQFHMWEILQQDNPIWYIDATGSILKDRPNNKDVNLYSILCYDRQKGKHVQIAEFFSDDQKSLTINTFFLQIKKNLEINIAKKKKALPKVIVTDKSWALINSVIETFNNCTINHYLDWCFSLIVNKSKSTFKNSSMPVLFYLCSSHFIKNITFQTNKTLNLKRNYKTLDNDILCKIKTKFFFIQSFTLLQNSVNFDEFNTVLSDLFFIFKSKTKSNNFDDSFNRISANQYLRGNSVMCDLSKNDEEKVKNFEEYKYISSETIRAIKQNSPFEKYYKKFETDIGIRIDKSNDMNAEINEYYCPTLLNIVIKKLHLMPLWSGVVVFRDGPVGNFESHLTNNPVELSFSHKRNSILRINKSCKIKRFCMPSEYISLTYKRLLSNYLAFYSDIPKEPSMPTSLSNETENWGTKRFGVQNAKSDSLYNKSNLSFSELKQYSCYKDLFQDSNIISELVYPSNGSFFELEGKTYEYSNTCSIDYFILFVSIISKSSKSNIDMMIDKDWKKLFIDLKNCIWDLKSLDMARHSFLKFKNHILSSLKNEYLSSTNCFLSEYEAYMGIYNKLQNYKWTLSCKDNCKGAKSGTACSFSLREVMGKVCLQKKEKELIHEKGCPNKSDKWTFEFLQTPPPMLIVLYNLKNSNDIPKELNCFEFTYNLVGYTLFSNNHFIAKVLVNNNFCTVDNLFYAGKTFDKDNWKIQNIFYKLK